MAADEMAANIRPFLENHCYECHDDGMAKADLNLLDLDYAPHDPENFAMWERIFRKVHSGVMPPKENPAPDSGELHTFLKNIARPLHQVDRSLIEKEGRVQARRLTREEYEYSLHDLLGVGVKLSDNLTADSENGFTNSAKHQQLSHFHLSNYLAVADMALDEAFERILVKEPKFEKHFGIKELTSGLGKGNYRGPEHQGDSVVSWSMRVQFYGRLPKLRVPEDGWYDITFHSVSGINRGSDGVTWGLLTTGSGNSGEPLQYPVGVIEGAKSPSTQTFRAWVRKNHCLIMKPAEAGAKTAKSNIVGKNGGTVIFKDRDMKAEGCHGIRFTSVTIKRVHPNGNRSKVMENLFPGLSEQEIHKGPSNPKSEARRILSHFAYRAFRRPVDSTTLAPYQQLVSKALDQGTPFPTAMRQGFHAILCSPNFLTFHEKPGKLDDYAIASRLSYMLWKSVPDTKLLSLAESGSLNKPTEITQQIDRLLASPKSQRFIQSFTDQWLELRKIDDTQPDTKRFRTYDPTLRLSILAETKAFVSELIRSDHSINNLLRSDFAFLNTRLQTHYKFGEVNVRPGKGLQKVAIPADGRSGLLTQAAILKVTADGSVTSPVLRGVFVNERLLGTHIDPPPPNIPAIEPDTRGAVSIRDQLAKHSDSKSCISCHLQIDPPGFALEEFDPIGNYRKFYGKYGKSAKVDPSGRTPEGEAFKNYNEWRNIQLARPQELAESFVEQILRYATGGEIRFSDTPVVKKIASDARSNQYGVRTLINNTLTSSLFLEK
ncbi:DUF1592 domain-containing protein [Rubritalea spongiae]|uniref:DUF1592 domain-containing protein n=1 Tax=Rubritalea spongiae TaxID=430797 RepID=UPI0036156951